MAGSQQAVKAYHARPSLSWLRQRSFYERDFKLPWREAGPPNHHDDKVDSDQWVVNKELFLYERDVAASPDGRDVDARRTRGERVPHFEGVRVPHLGERVPHFAESSPPARGACALAGVDVRDGALSWVATPLTTAPAMWTALSGACALAQRSAPGSRDVFSVSFVEFGGERRMRMWSSVRQAEVSALKERRVEAAAAGESSLGERRTESYLTGGDDRGINSGGESRMRVFRSVRPAVHSLKSWSEERRLVAAADVVKSKGGRGASLRLAARTM